MLISSEAAERTIYNEGMIFGARSLALGGCTVADRKDLGTIYSNPAALALMSGDASISLSYNNQFAIEGWKEDKFAFAAKPWGRIRVGFLRNSNTAEVYEEAGVNLWTDTRLVSGIGLKVSERMALGANYQRLDYQLEVDNENKKQSLNLINMGCLYQGERLSWGLALHNWEPLNKNNPVAPTYRLGLDFHTRLVDYKVEVSNWETAVSEQRQWSVRSGVEFAFAPGLVLRIGSTALDKTANIALGLGISLKNIILDYSYTTPYKIQASHQISTTYYF